MFICVFALLCIFICHTPFNSISRNKFDLFSCGLGGGSVVVDLLFIVTPIVGVCKCSIFCCTLLYVHSSFAIILIGKRELVALLVCLPGVW